MVINEIRLNPEDHHTFAQVLNENGYETAYIGKWHMYAAELGNHYDPKNSYIPEGPDRLGFDDFFAAYNFRHEYETGTAYYHLNSPEKIFYEKYEPDAQTDMAIEQLRRLSAGDKPFALFLSIGTPHDPWVEENVPKKYLEMMKNRKFFLPENYLPQNDPHADSWARLSQEERKYLTEWMRVYYAMTANLDENFGRLRQAVRELGLEENTILIFTSDHGELFGAHGRRAKNIFYEEAVRVPFLICWKGHLAEGASRDFVFNTVDIMPSLLSMMGLPGPRGMEGADRSSCIKGEDDTEEGALMMGTGPTAVFGDGYEWRAYRTKQYTYAVYLTDGQEFLFDDDRDPKQMQNLIDIPEYTALAKDLRRKMYQKMEEIGDTFEKNTYYEKNWICDRKILKKTERGKYL